MKKGKLLLGGLLLFFATRKKYTFNIQPFIIPNPSLFGATGNPFTDKRKLIKLIKNLDISFEEGHWVIQPKPIDGFRIPIRITLPATSPLAIPQLIWQIETKMVMKPIKAFGKVIAYKIYFKGPITIYI